DNCNGNPLAAGNTCTVNVRLDCRSSQTGPQTGTLTYTDPTPVGSGGTAVLNLSGICADLTIAPTSAALGTVTIGSSTTGANSTLSNHTAAAIATGAAVIAPAGSPLSVTDTCAGSVPTTGCTVTPHLNCTGHAEASYSATATYTSPSGVTAVLSLSGSCSAISIAPASESITGYLGVAINAGAALVKNNGLVSTDFTGPGTVSGTYSAVVSFPGGCTGVASNATCSVNPTLTCSAAGTGAAVGTYTDTAGNSVTLTVNGTCLDALSITPASRFVGNSPSPGHVDGTAVTLSNASAGTLTLNSATFTGSGAGAYSVSSTTCGATIGPSPATCTYTARLTCTGAMSGSNPAAVMHVTDTHGNSATVNLTGHCN
ncbi:MAG: hypothetical protein ACHREM_24720, partial [Polyangiales bacterium]